MATIQNFVSSPPEEKYFTCRCCRGKGFAFVIDNSYSFGMSSYVFCCQVCHDDHSFWCTTTTGCFPTSTVERIGLICHSCVESRKSEDSSIRVVGKRVRYIFLLLLGFITNRRGFK